VINLTEIKAAFIRLHGKTRKIETGVLTERVEDIKDTLKAVNALKPNFVEIQRAFYKGGFKDKDGHNIQKQFKNIEGKHNEKF
jgi:hypothetical protein